VTADTDALGEVSVLVEHEGKLVSGQSVSTDTLEASARAYLRALSNAMSGISAGPSPTSETEAAPPRPLRADVYERAGTHRA
jgi:LeuA-like protein with dimerisation domain